MPELSDADVLTLTLAGCNAAELAEYGHLPEQVAQLRMDRALADYVLAMRRPREGPNRVKRSCVPAATPSETP